MRETIELLSRSEKSFLLSMHLRAGISSVVTLVSGLWAAKARHLSSIDEHFRVSM